MAQFPPNIAGGAANLLRNCAGTKAGDKVLILHEDSDQAYYDTVLVGAVAQAASEIGAEVQLLTVPFSPLAPELAPEVKVQMAKVDQTIFLARVGDQLRFSDLPANGRSVISYALDADMLGCGFGQAHYGGFTEMKTVLNDAFSTAHDIHVTCPKGTDFRGTVTLPQEKPADVSLARFPMLIGAPMPAVTFKGRVALPGFLVGTGSQYYSPFAVEYDGELFAEFDGNQLGGFEGDVGAVKVANDHYDKVSSELGIARNFVHSWHVGMHPGCRFKGKASDAYDRWSGSAFGNPRLLHFHTCGNYAPGEISWNVLDPTVRLDGVPVWENGRLYPDRVAGGAEILAAYSCAALVFGHPETEVGL